MNPLHRYKPIIPEWSRFLQVVETRDPPAVRARTGRLSVDELRSRLEGHGFRVEPFPGLPDHLKVVHQPYPVSQTAEHWLGMFYVQQAATGAAAVELAPEPGERVLDLCAAPGGKTTHLSDLMDGKGCLLAVDVNESRLRALLGNVYRTGHTNVLVVASDGGRIPDGALFDRVLVDAPCSAEGTLRKRKGRLRPQDPRFHKDVLKRQERLLRRAIELTRSGGEILYSTCTFAPEENEGILTAVLADAPVELEPLRSAVPCAPGIVSFEGRHFDPRVEMAGRIYPHLLDSGGLFLARLRRLDDGVERRDEWHPVPAAFPHGLSEAEDPVDDETAAAAIADALEVLRRELGFSADELGRFDWMQRGGHMWANSCGEWPVPSWQPDNHWRVISVGLRGLSPGPGGWMKPTNDLLRVLDAIPEALRVSPDDAGWRSLLARETLPAEGPNGVRVLTLDGRPAGRGIVKDGRVRHEIAKPLAKALSEVIEARAQPVA